MSDVLGISAGTQMVIVFFLLLALRVPVAFSLGLSAMYAMWQIGFGLELAGDLIATGITKFSLLAIPFFILAGTLMGALGIAERIIRSPFSRVLKGIREDETAAQALGKNTYRFKMIIFVTGCGMAGLAGSLYAHYISYIDPGSFVMWLTFFIILIIMLGGLGNNVGALVATTVFVLLREGLRFVKLPEGLNPAALQQLIFGLLLIAATLYMPRGLIPERKITYRRKHDDAQS